MARDRKHQKQGVVAAAAKPSFSAAEYNAVAMGSQLLGIRLLKSSFDVKPDLYEEEDDLPRLSYGREALACDVSPSGEQVAVLFRYNVTGRRGRKKVLTCEVEYLVVYGVPHDCSETAKLGFCRNVGAFAAYPYFRSLVSQFAWNAGIELPPLPAIASTAHIPRKQSVAEASSDGQP